MFSLSPIAVSFAVNILVLAFKFFLYFKTNSLAILSDALESVINVIASGFAAISIFFASRPPDESHPYGHGKIEYFSAGFEGGLIIFAAYGIIHMAVDRLKNPAPIHELGLGLVGTILVIVINLCLGVWLISKGKKEGSIALEADGKHILTDAYTSLGIIVSFVLIMFTGKLWLDILFCLLIALNIIFMGSKLIITSFSGLMQAKDPAFVKEISELLKRHRRITNIDIHELRAWRAGRELFVDFHLILPMELPLYLAHKEAKRFSKLLKSKFGPNTHVMVQLDPCLENYCKVCQKNLEALRTKDKSITSGWDLTDFTKPKEPL